MPDIAASILAKIKNMARVTRKPYQLCLQIFFQEEFLRRLSGSKYAGNFILKGGLFIYTLTNFESRPTVDIDFLLHHLENNPDHMDQVLAEILATPTGNNDVVILTVSKATPISLQRQYPGVSAQLIGHIKNVRVPFDVDIGVGDVIVPKAQKRVIKPLLAGFDAPEVLVYSLESTIAEKLDAILQRFELTGRMKDFFDIYYLSHTFDFEGHILLEAIAQTLTTRGTPYEPSSFDRIVALAEDADMRTKWRYFIRTMQSNDLALTDVIVGIDVFLHPIWDAMIGNTVFQRAYRATYPDRDVQIIDVDYEQGYRGNLAELLAAGDWDLAYISTQEFDLTSLVRDGLAKNISTVPKIPALADNLYPSIRKAASVNGKLVAVPMGFVASMVMGIHMMSVSESNTSKYTKRAAAHLEALGFTADDQPHTFEQLCALGQCYMQLPKDARKGTTFITSEGNQTAYVLALLLDLYESQYLATGEFKSFDTEVFRTALAQVGALSVALATDPKNTYDSDGLCFPLLNDCSQMILSDGFFLQLGDHPSIPARMDLAIVNPKSSRAQEAVEYILLSSDQDACYDAPTLCQTIDYDALVRQSYDQDIAAQIQQGEDQSVIDKLTALRDTGDASGYQYSKAEIERYGTEVAPKLIFPQTVYIDTQSATQQYLLGKLDVDGFIAALDKATAR